MHFPFPFRKKPARETKIQRSLDYEYAAELSPTLNLPLPSIRSDERAGRQIKKPAGEQVTGFKLEQNNEFILGTVAGLLGAAVKYGFNELAQLVGLAKYDNNATSITVVMKGYEYTPAFWLFGFANALFIGAFFGVLIAFMMSYIFTERYYLFKGAGIGVGLWLFNFGLAAKVFNYPEALKYSLGDVVSFLFSLVIYAVVTVYALKRLGLFKMSGG